MANGWIKSLQCKSKVLDDVVSNHHQYRLLRNSGSCKNGVRSLKDVVKTAQERRPRKLKPPPLPPRNSTPEIESDQAVPRFPASTSARTSASTSARHARTMSESYFPTLTELPEGHPSRKVVEIIFHTSWSPKAFSGRIEVLFKVQNLPRTVARFEEYREAVKSRASCGGGEDRARCVADGNEVMRFFCLGPTAGGAYETGGCSAWSLSSGKGTTICTFSGSGDAHESGGGGRGRRAMLVCRVIAGRVYQQLGKDSILEEERVGYDSVSGENGELLVFDSRAVLPCFLIIYKI